MLCNIINGFDCTWQQSQVFVVLHAADAGAAAVRDGVVRGGGGRGGRVGGGGLDGRRGRRRHIPSSSRGGGGGGGGRVGRRDVDPLRELTPAHVISGFYATASMDLSTVEVLLTNSFFILAVR